MTPQAVLDTVLARFPVMFIQEPALTAYLTQALGVYQDKAGALARLTVPAEGNTASVPPLFACGATCLDSKGRWHDVVEVAATDTIPAHLAVTETTRSARPYTLWYFQNLRGMGHRTDELPAGVVGLFQQYLEALISLPNNRRQREVMQATGVPVDLPGDEELKQRLDLLETEMEESAAIIPMATVLY